MSQVGEFFDVVSKNQSLSSNNKIFEGHKNC